MIINQLAAALEERLFFYTELMNNMADAIEYEDPERVEYFSGLEAETTRIIVSLEKSLAMLGKTETLQISRNDENDTLLLKERVARARTNAIAAANRNKALLENHLEDIRTRMDKAARHPAKNTFSPPDPSFIDLRI